MASRWQSCSSHKLTACGSSPLTGEETQQDLPGGHWAGGAGRGRRCWTGLDIGLSHRSWGTRALLLPGSRRGLRREAPAQLSAGPVGS